MKLLYKTTRDYLFASVSILFITGIALFLILREEVSDEMNEQLELQADELFADARTGKLVNTPFVKIYPAPPNTNVGQVFGDSMIYDRIQEMVEEYHYLIETKDVGDKRYQTVTMTSHIGWKRYYLTIFYIFVLTAVMLTGSGVLINYLSNKKIWAPFFENIKSAQAFSVTSPTGLTLLDSSIDEFKILNNTFTDLTERSRREYQALREFTENASHETQTPLTIIQSKLDRMSQMEVGEAMAEYIVQAKSGVERLSKMNKSLLLLAKLDNHVFTNSQPLFINEMLDMQLGNMEELFGGRQIQVTRDLEATSVYADAYLVETLITNLLTNALRYTPRLGQVDIQMRNNRLAIANTGPEPDFSKEHIFDRFTKGQSHPNSTGLGLAIAREICFHNKWSIGYDYLDGLNRFEVRFD
jgi:signal transduction histidine kinase